jgi:predicted MFS family arabinose efflux permease
MSLAFPAALLVLLLGRGMAGVLVAALLVGAGMASGVLENVMLQSWVPDSLRGRVYSFDVLVSLCAIPAGYLLAGIAIDSDAAPALGIAGALACVLAAGATLASRLATYTGDGVMTQTVETASS